MISSDPKLPLTSGVRPLEPTSWIKAFVARFYALWKELQSYLIKLDARVAVLEAFGFVAGTYTPTLSNTTNVAASTAYVCPYLVIGSVGITGGRVAVDTTSTSTDTVLGISLPVTSAIANAEEVCGVAAMQISANPTQVGVISGDATNDRATLTFNALGASNYSWYFIMIFRIL